MSGVPSREVTRVEPLAEGVAVAVGVGENAGLMSERTPSTPSTQDTSSVNTPRLRLAGTNAGPVTEEERQLLNLRARLVRVRALQGVDAEAIRERLDRAGRKDPIQVATGVDAFTRAAADLDSMLTRIDARLAEIDAVRGVSIEIDAQATGLLRRP
jgi:hypothetical protein